MAGQQQLSKDNLVDLTLSEKKIVREELNINALKLETN